MIEGQPAYEQVQPQFQSYSGPDGLPRQEQTPKTVQQPSDNQAMSERMHTLLRENGQNLTTYVHEK